jgi:hypothetical protein
MATALNAQSISIVTATSVEARAARKALPNLRVVEAGIALVRNEKFGDIAISCGLAGGLREDLPTRTIVIPYLVRRPDGSMLSCDVELTDHLSDTARDLGYEPVNEPLLTSESLIHGEARAAWARDFAAVDMETGLINAPRVACVRVILDTPLREISPAWLNPRSAIFQPRAWSDLPFLAREGPRCAKIAAGIIAAALSG